MKRQFRKFNLFYYYSKQICSQSHNPDGFSWQCIRSQKYFNDLVIFIYLFHISLIHRKKTPPLEQSPGGMAFIKF